MNASLTITLIQTNLFWEDKAANLAMFTEKINSINQPTEVIILPEMFTTGFSMKPKELAETMDGNSVSWMRKIATEKKVIITGSMMIEENGNYYNRLIWMLPNGQLGYYDKKHLFSFAQEEQHYSSGNKRLIASVKGWRINLQICYDLRFPVWARQQQQNDEPEFDILMYVANWPQRRAYAWKTLLTARAIENQAYVIDVNRVGNDGNEIYHSGDSMVIDALGEILFHKADDETVFTITLQKENLQQTRNKFPFLHDADDFTILAM